MRDLTKERDERCRPLAVELLKMLAEEGSKLVHGGYRVTENKIVDYYSDLYVTKFIKLMIEKDVPVSEISYIFQIAMQPIQLLQDRTKTTIDERIVQATSHLFGVTEMNDLKLSQLIAVLDERGKTVDKSSIQQV